MMKGKKLLMLVIGVAVAITLLTVGTAYLSRRPVEVGLVDGRLRDCPPEPNCVCSEDPATRAAIGPLRFDGDPRAAFDSLVAHVARADGATVVTQEERYAHAVFLTPLLHFADDLELRLDADAGVIHVRSASRIGHSDLGANRERVEALRASWSPPAAPATTDDAAAD